MLFEVLFDYIVKRVYVYLYGFMSIYVRGLRVSGDECWGSVFILNGLLFMWVNWV